MRRVSFGQITMGRLDRLGLWFWLVWGLLGVFVSGQDGDGRRTVVFHTGAVLSMTGSTSGMVQARRGYELFHKVLNEQNGGLGMQITGRDGYELYAQFSFMALDDNSSSEFHRKQVRKLLDEEKVDFLFGSHPAYVFDETKMTNKRGILNMQCCVGPDAVYKQGFRNVFGVQASNTKYPLSALRSMFFKGIRRLAFITQQGNVFTETTCSAGEELVNTTRETVWEDPPDTVFSQKFALDEKINITMENIAIELKKLRVEGIVACAFLDTGKLLVDALHDIQYPLKSFFLTVGPTLQEWVESMEPPRAKHLLSAAQWLPNMKYQDTFYGTSADYVRKFTEMTGGDLPPDYVAAGASAAGYALAEAIKAALERCALSNVKGNLTALLYDEEALDCLDGEQKRGYDRVTDSLELLDLQTVFGRIKFNQDRRNIGMEPATTQVFPARGKRTGWVIDTVLPLQFASAALKMPATNPYKPTCEAGTYIGKDEFDPCEICPAGEVSDVPNTRHCDSCPIGKWMAKPGQRACSLCPNGSTTLKKGAESLSECQCKPGYYEREGRVGMPCLECPEGATCDGGQSLPIPDRGYWTDVVDRDVMYECDPPSACLGGPKIQCAVGYTGRLCGHCEVGYFSLIERCYKCRSGAFSILLIVAMIIGWYILNGVVAGNLASLDMLLSWAQLANIVGDVNLRWPGRLESLFGIANILDFDVDILEPGCLVSSWSYSHNFVVQLLLPFLMGAMAFTGYAASRVIFSLTANQDQNKRGEFPRIVTWIIHIPESQAELDAKWDATVAAFLSSIEMTYVTVTKYCFDAFKCEDVAGVKVLRADPGIVCNTKEHGWVKGLGVVGMLVCTLGYFLFTAWKLFQMKWTRSFAEPINLRRYGFLYARFELEYFYMSIIISLRRMLFVATLVFVNDPSFQAAILGVIIIASLMLHVYSASYIDTYLDILFSFLLVALMFETFGGMMFYNPDFLPQNREILEWIVLSACLMLAMVFLVIFVLEMVGKYQVRVLMKLHQEAVNRQLKGEGKPKRKVSHELLSTFNPGFLYKALVGSTENLLDWEIMTNMLEDYMSDQSECSFLSTSNVARFWRKLVGKFPELVDYLTITDESTREHFCLFAKSLYRDFYLMKKLEPLPLYSVLNWRDRSALAQWLALASRADREFFSSYMARLIDRAYGEEASRHFLEKMESMRTRGFAALSMARSDKPMGQSRSGGAIKRLTRSRSIAKVYREIEMGRDPMQHGAKQNDQDPENPRQDSSSSCGK